MYSNTIFVTFPIHPTPTHLTLTKNLKHRKFPRAKVGVHRVLPGNRRAKYVRLLRNHHRRFVCNVSGAGPHLLLCRLRHNVGKSTCCRRDTRLCRGCSICTPFSSFGLCTRQRVWPFLREYPTSILKDRCSRRFDGIRDML